MRYSISGSRHDGRYDRIVLFQVPEKATRQQHFFYNMNNGYVIEFEYHFIIVLSLIRRSILNIQTLSVQIPVLSSTSGGEFVFVNFKVVFK